MRRYTLRLTDRAETDLRELYDYLKDVTSPSTARRYVNRIVTFLTGLEQFPMRGTVRTELRAGLRIIGFERRVSVAFIVEETEVVILRLLYGGRSLEPDDLDPPPTPDP